MADESPDPVATVVDAWRARETPEPLMVLVSDADSEELRRTAQEVAERLGLTLRIVDAAAIGEQPPPGSLILVENLTEQTDLPALASVPNILVVATHLRGHIDETFARRVQYFLHLRFPGRE